MFKTQINWKQEKENLLNFIHEGTPLAKIGEHYGVSRQRIKQVLGRLKVDLRPIDVRHLKHKTRLERFWGTDRGSELWQQQRAKFRAKRVAALNNNVEFSIQFGDIVWPTHCPILGLELDYFAEKRQENSCSFDRIDSNRGYVVGNVFICSWRANRIKNDGTANEHRLIAEYIEKNTIDKYKKV
jgi:hypothetical protein